MTTTKSPALCRQNATLNSRLQNKPPKSRSRPPTRSITNTSSNRRRTTRACLLPVQNILLKRSIVDTVEIGCLVDAVPELDWTCMTFYHNLGREISYCWIDRGRTACPLLNAFGCSTGSWAYICIDLCLILVQRFIWVFVTFDFSNIDFSNFIFHDDFFNNQG